MQLAFLNALRHQNIRLSQERTIPIRALKERGPVEWFFSFDS